MGGDFYPISNKRKCPAEKAGHSIREEYQFYFKSTKSNLRYCIEAVYHAEDFFAIKYYCKNHKVSKNRYSLATNTHEPYKILRTCIQVIPLLQRTHPNASFVAVGSRSISANRIEPAEATVRFRLYYNLVFQYFSVYDHFFITQIPDISGIGLLYIKDIVDAPPHFSNNKVLIKRIQEIKAVVLECYDDIHIPD